ncbi:MAG TPA: SPOR domain-containing protein [Thermoanaerobaculia bacterium]|nr:SPOR domain-containing protein [Thermoanaerobaculia bacterium]
MPHTMVTFRLHRSGVILLVVLCVVLSILIYVAGYVTAVYTRPAVAERRTGFSPSKAPAPPPRGRAEARPTLSEPREALTLRVSIATSEEEAKGELARLTGFGLQPVIVQMPTSAGVTLYNICVGRYETRSAANAAAKELQSRLGFLPVIVPANL